MVLVPGSTVEMILSNKFKQAMITVIKEMITAYTNNETWLMP